VERWLDSERNVRLCAMVGAVTLAFSSIFVKLSHASAPSVAIYRCAFALPILGLLAWRDDRRYGSRSWTDRRWALAAGVLFGADTILWNYSIGDIGAGLATVLANVQVVLVPFVAWAALAERPERRVLAALPFALLGVVLISGLLEHGAYGRDPGRGTLLGLGAGITYSGFLLLIRRGGADLRHPAGPLFDATLAAGAFSVVFGLIIGGDLEPHWPGVAWLIMLAFSSQVFGWLLITSSLPRLPAALTSLLLMIQPVGSVALAAVIFGEAPDAVQLTGVAMVLASMLIATRRLSRWVAATRGAYLNRSSA
jgi:drug/metabolite transporter (DMT)-like permease